MLLADVAGFAAAAVLLVANMRVPASLGHGGSQVPGHAAAPVCGGLDAKPLFRPNPVAAVGADDLAAGLDRTDPGHQSQAVG